MTIKNVDLKTELYVNIKGLCVVKFISSGSTTCYRHGASCGGQNARMRSGPYEIYIGGQQVFIKLLQNFNLYEIGSQGIL